MINTQPRYQYQVEDSINGLTINYQGQKSWWTVLYSVVVSVFLFLFLLWLIRELAPVFAMEQVDLTYLLIPILGILVFGYAINRTLSSGLDALFNVEKVIITNQSIQIDKSGFQSIERSKLINTAGKMCFVLLLGLERSLSVHKSKFIAQLYNFRLFQASNTSPMRCFLRGISQEDAIVILEKIKSKYPQYTIYYQKSFWG